ncbi:hypothetical protein Lesp02_21770 [Lentzea sp. NBRC 105346]|uniref:DUF7919 family protein n=1 Tax=Lentzea sp. NBRC 105346 TaxID=3032205 RepID=UPI0024A107D3|nr:hypothetical protein [Lentzea sp. NBRC 105346]GLZ29987.1 hypothetical protein Lesp02_21770 [Lentzea sp. NBRC 105346]
MTWFADLTPYEYLRSVPGMVNVGWLSKKAPFPTGPVPDGVLPALRTLASQRTHVTRGWHWCEFCGGHRDERARGHMEIHVPGADGRSYSAPDLLPHYIEAHSYQPPLEFVEAVLGFARLSEISAPVAFGSVTWDVTPPLELLRLTAVQLEGGFPVSVLLQPDPTWAQVRVGALIRELVPPLAEGVELSVVEGADVVGVLRIYSPRGC